MTAIDIGCGGDSQGDIGIDIRLAGDVDVQGDARQLPVRDHAVDAVYLIDVVEHVRYRELPGVLAEVYRVLSPGGHVWIRTPDFEWIANHYQDVTDFRLQRKLYGGYTAPIDTGDDYEANRHQSIYTPGILASHLESAGFTHIQVDQDLPPPNHWNMAVGAQHPQREEDGGGGTGPNA